MKKVTLDNEKCHFEKNLVAYQSGDDPSSKKIQVYRESPPWLYFVGGSYAQIPMRGEPGDRPKVKAKHMLTVTKSEKESEWNWSLHVRERYKSHEADAEYHGTAVRINSEYITGHLITAKLSGTIPQSKHPHGIYLLPERRSDYDLEIGPSTEATDDKIIWTSMSIDEHRRSRMHPVHHGMYLNGKGVSSAQAFTLTKFSENKWTAAIPRIGVHHAHFGDALEVAEEWYYVEPSDEDQWILSGL